MDGILKRVDTLAGKGDEEIYGRDGVFPLVRNILRDLLAKLAKIDVTLDNLNKISGEAVDSTKDLKLLRNDLDETVTAIGNLVDELDRMIPFQDQTGDQTAMKKILCLLFLFLLLGGCGSKPTPGWIVAGNQQIENYQEGFPDRRAAGRHGTPFPEGRRGDQKKRRSRPPGEGLADEDGLAGAPF